MSIQTSASISVVESNSKANFPFVVEGQNTENWNPIKCAVTLPAAIEIAQALVLKYPKLPIRIAHHTGGLIQTDLLPHFKQATPGEVPYRHALWTGPGRPPPVNARVSIRINGIGMGTVKGYAVHEGYLAVMVLADEETRPAWHKKQNPVNHPMLTFGAELSPY